MRRLLLAPLFLAAIGHAAAAAAAAQTAPGGVFGEVLEVRVVNLEVVVTDRQGNRVYGLGPEDFRLSVDGEDVAIDYFTEIAGGVAGGGAAGTPGIPAATAGEPVATSYLVLVDDFFSIARDRDLVLEALAGQLGHLGPADRMAVVAWDGRSLDMLTSWSGSQPALERALAAAQERPALGLQRLAERRAFERDGRLASDRRGGSRFAAFRRLDLEETAYVQRLAEQVDRSVSGAAAALRAFAAPPGRKVLLLLAGGWPAQPVEYAIDEVPVPIYDGPTRSGEEIFAPLVETANLLGYTIYPVDVPGFDHESTISAADSAPRTGVGRGLREQTVHHGLALLADATGGRALVNAERAVALEEAALDTRSYYWLGFTADRQFDERRHEVRVELARRDLAVRHREGFQDFSRPREVTMAVESALLFGHPASTGAVLPLRIGTPQRAGLGKVELPLELAIPADAVTFLPGEGGWESHLELRVAAVDEHGARSPVPVVPISFALAEPPGAGTFLRYATSVELRRQRHDLVVAVYDPASGALLSARAQVDPR